MLMSEMFRKNYSGYYTNTVTVVGAAGHVGLPLSLLIANSGYNNVYGLDIDENKCNLLNSGRIPFIENDAQELLVLNLKKKSLYFGTDKAMIKNSDYVIIIMGTPVDSEGNASTVGLLKFIKNDL